MALKIMAIMKFTCKTLWLPEEVILPKKNSSLILKLSMFLLWVNRLLLLLCLHLQHYHQLNHQNMGCIPQKTHRHWYNLIHFFHEWNVNEKKGLLFSITLIVTTSCTIHRTIFHCFTQLFLTQKIPTMTIKGTCFDCFPFITHRIQFTFTIYWTIIRIFAIVTYTIPTGTPINPTILECFVSFAFPIPATIGHFFRVAFLHLHATSHVLTGNSMLFRIIRYIVIRSTIATK